MNRILPAFAFFLSIVLCAGASEVILQDDFTLGEGGEIVSGREPVVGSVWQGLAEVHGGALVHGSDFGNRTAFTELEIPSHAESITVTIEGIYDGGGQFGFGFTDNPSDLLGEGANNRGLIWGYIAGGGVCLFGGTYGGGTSMQATLTGLHSGLPFELEFTAKLVQGGDPVPVSFIFNGQQALSGDLLPTAEPGFLNFFIQFRGGDEAPARSSIFKTTITVE